MRVNTAKPIPKDTTNLQPRVNAPPERCQSVTAVTTSQSPPPKLLKSETDMRSDGARANPRSRQLLQSDLAETRGEQIVSYAFHG
jgi:hypothetical protein